jgi:hypothetical protein
MELSDSQDEQPEISRSIPWLTASFPRISKELRRDDRAYRSNSLRAPERLRLSLRLTVHRFVVSAALGQHDAVRDRIPI